MSTPRRSAILGSLTDEEPVAVTRRGEAGGGGSERPPDRGSLWKRLNHRLAVGLWWTGSTTILAGLIVAGAGTGAMAAWLITATPIAEIERYDPPEMTVVLDRNDAPFATLFEEKRRVVPLAEMPDRLPEAFIAIEDTEFRHHIGINPKGIVRAALLNAQRGSASQGASTITMQLPRNLIAEIGREKTIHRKIHEALVALQMERLYSKDQILELYLNQIYLGSGTYGVEAASQAYFGKSVRELEVAEMALLAGLPQRPERFSPLNNIDRARERRNQVLDRLFDLNWLDGPEFARAKLSDVTLGGAPSSSPAWAHYFVDAARREVAAQPQLDASGLRQRGWRIATTMDPAAQRIAQESLVAALDAEEMMWVAERPLRGASAREEPEWYVKPAPGQVRLGTVVRVFPESLVVELGHGWRGDLKIPEATQHLFTAEAGVAPGAFVDVQVDGIEVGSRKLWEGRLLPQRRMQGAIVALDRRTGEARALVGGRRYLDPANDGFFNRAVAARRQAGSTMKPFFFATALEHGMTPDTVIADSPLVFANGYAPRNFENRFHGPTSLQVALEHSRNIPTIRIVQQVGLRSAIARVQEFNIAPGAPHWDMPEHIPVVLGTSSVTPLELAGAYLAFANAGLAVPPSGVRWVRNSHGHVIHRRELRPTLMLDDRTAAMMTQMLTGVMTHGSGRHARAELPDVLRDSVAGKSGTTNDNRDAWFAGFTPEMVIVVWVGFDQPLPLGEERTGGRVAGAIWGKLVKAYWDNGVLHDPGAPALPDGWERSLASVHTGEPVPAGQTVTSAGFDWGWRMHTARPAIVAPVAALPAPALPSAAPPP